MVAMDTATTSDEMQAEIVRLLQSRRYDPEILPQLEKWVDHQVQEGLYDSDANLSILKMYQFHPASYNATVVSKILIKALMTLPSPDFLCSLYLIPDRMQDDEPIPIISKLATLLETGRFKEFWETCGSCKELVSTVPGFEDSMRLFMLSIVSRTYKKIDKAVLKDLLNLGTDDTALDEILENNGWEESEKGVIVLPDNDENQPRSVKQEEQLTFRQVASKML
eukprot:Plantae.Rhodophyta-Hildenbrandia_rubra.ctg4972.p1 GENE.Plantae.Rhodophyta-Hildenbrandia_rubra.ctg4972~~Plantae.Rhodophyta-Hildenbrandia_rubra.ctg4972.p1  ORF type:complete len:236 (+),score=32.90 Plantae.Rhodophyta-Hildenbrandia_rubra.ctg4972:42-710(+)